MLIIVTRAKEDSENFIAEYDLKNTFVFPCLEFTKPDDDYVSLDAAIRANHNYAWVVFLSQKAAEVFFERIISIGGHIFNLHPGLKVAAVGEATKKYIEKEIGFPVDFCPTEFNSDVFIDEFGSMLLGSGLGLGSELKILVPRTAMVKDDFETRLEAKAQVPVDIVEAYSTRCPNYSQGNAEHSICELKSYLEAELEKQSAAAKQDQKQPEQNIAISFTSSQTVRNFVQLIQELDQALIKSAYIFSLGPKTSKTIREYPQCFDLDKLIEAPEASLTTMASMLKSFIDGNFKTKTTGLS